MHTTHIHAAPDAFTRPPRCEYGPALAGRAVVIDNGSHSVKAGWAGENAPRVVFRSIATRARARAAASGGAPAQRVCVGDWGPGGGARGWEFSRGASRTPFEAGVVVNFDTQELLLDYAFDRLGVTGARASVVGCRV